MRCSTSQPTNLVGYVFCIYLNIFDKTTKEHQVLHNFDICMLSDISIWFVVQNVVQWHLYTKEADYTQTTLYNMLTIKCLHIYRC